MKTKQILILVALTCLSTLNPQLSTVFAQGTAFTYQGRLNDGTSPATGIYDLRFAIYDAAGGGSVAGVLTNAATPVTNGLFTVTLDFGSGVFDGSARWLEIGVRTNGGGAFAALSPRQAVTATPYALQAAAATTATSAATAAGVPASGIGPGTANINISGYALSAAYAGSAAVAANFTGTLAGDVTGAQGATTVERIRNVPVAPNAPATNQHLRFDGTQWVPAAVVLDTDVSGTLADAHLSTNVALLNTNQIFTGSNTFSGVVTATNLANKYNGVFTGSGAGLTSIPAGNLTGTVSLAQLPPSVVTNGNISAYAISSNQLDNLTWLHDKVNNFQDTVCYNRYRWTNVLAKIATGQNIRVLLDGTTLLVQGLLNYPVTTGWLATNRTCAGWFTTHGGVFEFSTSGAAYQPNNEDTNWYKTHELSTNIGGTITAVFYTYPYLWSVLEVDYLAWTNGASFKVQTNNGLGGSYSDVGGATFSGTSASSQQTGCSFFWTNTYAGALGWQVVQTTTGTNHLVNLACWNGTLSNSYTVGIQTASGSYLYQELLPSNVISGPIYSTWNPDLILWNSMEGTNAYFATNIGPWIQFYTNYCTNAAIVLCGTYRTIEDNPAMGSNPAQNMMIRSNVMNFATAGANIAYFDGWTPMESTNNEIARGFFDVMPPIFFNAAGYNAYGYMLDAWLGFGNAWLYK